MTAKGEESLELVLIIMPSGSKKRKAAKRKKEEEMGIHPTSPHSPTTTPQGSSGLDSENSEVEMDQNENFAYEVKEVGIEYVEEGNGTHVEQEVPAAELPIKEVVLEQVSSLEQVEVSEAAASATTEDPPASTVAEEQLPDVQRSEIAAAAAATATATTEVALPPLLEHRATLWNCCGLLDAFR